MKKIPFLALFAATQILIVILQVHKYSKKIELSFERQKNEHTLKQLIAKRQELHQELARETDRQAVARYATNHLRMQPIHISQMKRIKGDAYADHS